MSEIAFTSVAKNYVPKARILARTLKKFHPKLRFILILVDAEPHENPDPQSFDECLTIADLGLPVQNLDSWIFMHDIVELCTAVKGSAIKFLFEKRRAKNVLYLDPDIYVTNSLGPVFAALRAHSILLTPHLTQPEEREITVAFNECGSLKHGVFNLGFLAVRNSSTGRKFADWWSDRLLNLCYIDPSRGLFTDQKWADLIPVFFPDHEILRDPGLNAARWNVSQRKITRNKKGNFFANGKPLRFFHFSAFDSGEHAAMSFSFGGPNRHFQALDRLYQTALFMAGNEEAVRSPSKLSLFSTGEPITKEQRILYRSRPDLIKAFPKPQLIHYDEPCFLHWYKEALRSALVKQMESLTIGPEKNLISDIQAFLKVAR